MSKIIQRNVLVDFLKNSYLFQEISEAVNLADFNEYGLCPADQVPDDGLPYIVFVGRTAKDPIEMVRNSKAKILIIDKDINIPDLNERTVVRVENSRLFFCELLSFASNAINKIISPLASIHGSVLIGERALIGDYVCIEKNVIIGDDCKIGQGAIILSGVKIGNRVNIYPGAVIGTDGFGYEKRLDGTFIKFPHIGEVLIGNDVDIGANAVIDRGTLGATIIGDGVKIDNLVHISHNVDIGENSVIIANAMVGGGVKIGKNTWVGPSSSVVDRVSIGQNSFIGMGVSVSKDLAEKSRYTLKHFLNLFNTLNK